MQHTFQDDLRRRFNVTGVKHFKQYFREFGKNGSFDRVRCYRSIIYMSQAPVGQTGTARPPGSFDNSRLENARSHTTRYCGRSRKDQSELFELPRPSERGQRQRFDPGFWRDLRMQKPARSKGVRGICAGQGWVTDSDTFSCLGSQLTTPLRRAGFCQLRSAHRKRRSAVDGYSGRCAIIPETRDQTTHYRRNLTLRFTQLIAFLAVCFTGVGCAYIYGPREQVKAFANDKDDLIPESRRCSRGTKARRCEKGLAPGSAAGHL